MKIRLLKIHCTLTLSVNKSCTKPVLIFWRINAAHQNTVTETKHFAMSVTLLSILFDGDRSWKKISFRDSCQKNLLTTSIFYSTSIPSGSFHVYNLSKYELIPWTFYSSAGDSCIRRNDRAAPMLFLRMQESPARGKKCKEWFIFT